MNGLGYEQQVVRWTGDSTAGRLIPTTFPLDSGKVAVWICGKSPDANPDASCFRHNGTGMTATNVVGSATPQTDGITGFLSTGFVVTAGSGVGTFANYLNVKYSAVVMRDTTIDNRYLRIGSYNGLGNFLIGMDVFGPPGGYTSQVTGTFAIDYNGMTCSNATGSYVFTYLDATHGLLTPGYRGGGFIGPPPGELAVNLTFNAATRTILTGGFASPLTHVWVHRSFLPYKSTEFPTGKSMILTALSTPPYTNDGLIRKLGLASFEVGADQEVNQFGLRYHYVALSVDDRIDEANIFQSFKGTGTGSTVVVPLRFTPTLAFTVRYFTSAFGCRWRGLDHTGTLSNIVTGLSDASQGIVGIGTNTISVGTSVAPAGSDFYGWVFATGSTTAGSGWQLQRFDAKLRRELT